MPIQKSTKKTISVMPVFCIFLLLLQQLAPVVHAATLVEFTTAQVSDQSLSSNDLDLDPPDVSHDPVRSGVAGAKQAFVVSAIDMQGIQSVTLMVRGSNQDEYRSVPMQSVEGTNTYRVSIETTEEQKQLEYYFLVVDTGGNKVLNGFPYEPFERFLEAPVVDTAADIPQIANTSTSTSKEDAPESRTNLLLWGAVGLLVVGVLAASGSGSGSGEPETTVPVTVTVPLPR